MIERKIKIEESEDSIFLWGARQTGKSTLLMQRFPEAKLKNQRIVSAIEYKERIYKLSPFVGTFIPDDKRCTSNHYQGPKYFSYNGKLLTELRKEKEN